MYDLVIGKNFLENTQKVWAVKEKDYISSRLKPFVWKSSKKREGKREWEKVIPIRSSSVQ
jgi:hypothetical protein